MSAQQNPATTDNTQEIDWAGVTPEQWQQQIAQLSQQPIDPAERLYWMMCIRNWLHAHKDRYWPTANQQLGEDVLSAYYQALHALYEVTHTICDWPLAIHLNRTINKIEQQYDWQATPNMSDSLACYLGQMGEWNQTLAILQQQAKDSPLNLPLKEEIQSLKQTLAEFPYTLTTPCDEDLRLTPLEAHHLAAFSWQYDDPSIAQRCHLPQFADDQQWLNWLSDCKAEPNKLLYAIIHSEWGFIGSASIEVHNGVGFFYCWLGADFQAQGLAPKTTKLLLSAGTQHLGMTCSYAKIDSDNNASEKVLLKLGYQRLPWLVRSATAQNHHGNEILYYSGPQLSPEQSHQQVKQLILNMDCDLVLQSDQAETDHNETSVVMSFSAKPKVHQFSVR